MRSTQCQPQFVGRLGPGTAKPIPQEQDDSNAGGTLELSAVHDQDTVPTYTILDPHYVLEFGAGKNVKA